MAVILERTSDSELTYGDAQQYVLGFLFSPSKEQVALVLKQKPNWQENLLNGFGGKRKRGESYRRAMEREFGEAVGQENRDLGIDWMTFGTMDGTNWIDPFLCECFCAVSDLKRYDGRPGIAILNVWEMSSWEDQCVEGVLWMVYLAKDKLTKHDHPGYSVFYYR